MARIRIAVRALAKAPLLSMVVILSLGLGIGANTAIFSLLHQMVLASLPVQHPEELVLVTSRGESRTAVLPTTIPAGRITYSATPCSAGWKRRRGASPAWRASAASAAIWPSGNRPSAAA